MVPEAAKPEVEMPASVVPGETFLPGSQTTTLSMAPTGPSLWVPQQRVLQGLFLYLQGTSPVGLGPHPNGLI